MDLKTKRFNNKNKRLKNKKIYPHNKMKKINKNNLAKKTLNYKILEEKQVCQKDYHEIEKNIYFTYFLYKKIIIYILKVILLIYLMYLPQVLLKLIMLEEI